MIKEEKVKVKLNGRNISYYEDIGYEIPKYIDSKGRHSVKRGTEIEVFIKDLSKGSHAKITAICDVCGKEKELTYRAYLKNLDKYNFYTCDNCSQIKIKKTCIEKYGTDSPLKSKEVKEKIRNTNIKRYGFGSAMQNKDIKEKADKTVFERYGVKNVSQVDDFKEKVKKTNLEKYGHENYLHSDDFKTKNLKSLKEKYGDNITHNMQVPSIRRKASITRAKRSKCALSKQQVYLNDLFKTSLNYPFMNYNFDMFDSKNNVDIEYDGSGHYLSIKFKRYTPKEFFRKEKVRDIFSRMNKIKVVRIISKRDLLPSDEVLLDMYSKSIRLLRSVTSTTSQVVWNIDNGTYSVYPSNETFSYDYKELRTIP